MTSKWRAAVVLGSLGVVGSLVLLQSWLRRRTTCDRSRTMRRSRCGSFGASSHMLQGSLPPSAGATTEVVHIFMMFPALAVGGHTAELLSGFYEPLSKHVRLSAVPTVQHGCVVSWSPVTLRKDDHCFPHPELAVGFHHVRDWLDYVNDHFTNEPLPAATPSGRRIPLWQLHSFLIHDCSDLANCNGAQVCVMFRIHHAVGDGVAAMTTLLSDVLRSTQYNGDRDPHHRCDPVDPAHRQVDVFGAPLACAQPQPSCREGQGRRPSLSQRLRWTYEQFLALTSTVNDSPSLVYDPQRQQHTTKRKIVLLPPLPLSLVETARRALEPDTKPSPAHRLTVHEVLYAFLGGVTARMHAKTTTTTSTPTRWLPQPNSSHRASCLTPVTMPFDRRYVTSDEWYEHALCNRIVGVVTPLSLQPCLSVRERLLDSLSIWTRIKESYLVPALFLLMPTVLRRLPLASKQQGALQLGQRLTFVLSTIKGPLSEVALHVSPRNADDGAPGGPTQFPLSFPMSCAFGALPNLGTQVIFVTSYNHIHATCTISAEDADGCRDASSGEQTSLAELFCQAAKEEAEQWRMELSC